MNSSIPDPIIVEMRMKLGVKLDGLPAEKILSLAPVAEECAFDELWAVEDFGLAGGIAQVATLLAVTRRIRVGLGIAPAAVRNVMYLAMELAALSRMHPGRFLAGVGHGMPGWLDQVGARPENLLTALDEVATSLKRILAGEEVSVRGEHVTLDRVALVHPPVKPPPVSLGVRGPKGLGLARRVADGTILAEGSGPDYVAKVRRAAAGLDHRITVFSWLSVDADGDLARERIRPAIAKAMAAPYMAAQLGPLFGGEPGDEAIDRLAVAGTPEDCARQLRRLALAGADSAVLQPLLGHEAEQMTMAAREIRPLLADSPGAPSEGRLGAPGRGLTT